MSHPHIAGGGAAGAAGEYSADNPPTGGEVVSYENWKGGVESLAWVWAFKDWVGGGGVTATLSFEYDGALLTAPNHVGDMQNHLRLIAAPAGSWVATLVFTSVNPNSAVLRVGLAVARTGPIDNPTLVACHGVGFQLFTAQAGHEASYPAVNPHLYAGAGSGYATGCTGYAKTRQYTQAIYNAAADTITFRHSNGGIIWNDLPAPNIVTGVSADPVGVGFHATTGLNAGPSSILAERFIVKTGITGNSLEIGS